jgi:enoyl-CoA hydratase/carnithine racemase
VRDLHKRYTADDLPSDMYVWFLRSTDKKFFCPGPDFRYFQKTGGLISDSENRQYYLQQFFREIQGLAYKSTRIARPFIPYVDGVIGDAGVALALHSRMCVVGPSASLSFNQAARGWFPDSGSSYILARLDSPALGMYLALTGRKLVGYDIVKARVVDHFLSPPMVDALWEAGRDALNHRSFNTVFDDVTTMFGQQMEADWTFTLQDELERIEACFDKDSVELILEALQGQGEWGASVIETINRACPTSVKLTHRLLRDAAQADLKACLSQEYRCALSMMNRADFREGLNTTSVGKGQAPAFYPADLASVDDATISDLLSLPSGYTDLDLDAFEPVVAPHEVIDVQPFDRSFYSNRHSREMGLTQPTERAVRKKIKEVQNY